MPVFTDTDEELTPATKCISLRNLMLGETLVTGHKWCDSRVPFGDRARTGPPTETEGGAAVARLGRGLGVPDEGVWGAQRWGPHSIGNVVNATELPTLGG